jgi:preprotein translocase SecE subunit
MANESVGKVALPSSRRGVKGFISETTRELRKVSWPSPKETTRLTGVVLTVCIGQAFILLSMQAIFGQIITILEKGKL